MQAQAFLIVPHDGRMKARRHEGWKEWGKSGKLPVSPCSASVIHPLLCVAVSFKDKKRGMGRMMILEHKITD